MELPQKLPDTVAQFILDKNNSAKSCNFNRSILVFVDDDFELVNSIQLFIKHFEIRPMIYSAGTICPVCFDSSDVIFVKSVSSGQVFFACYACGLAWESLPIDEDFVDYFPHDFAPEGFALANLNDIEAAGFVSLIAEELSEDHMPFTNDECFILPERNPQDYDGKIIAIHLATPLPNGEKEWGLLLGKLRFKSDKLIVDVDSEPMQFEILREWLCRITPAYSSIVGPYEAELDLSLALRAFPNDTPPSELMEMARRIKAKATSK